MAEDFNFINAPGGANPEPNAYHVVYTDRNGTGGSEKVIPTPDPALDQNLTEQQICDKVKALLMQTRGDWYNRGVTADKVTVSRIGPMTSSDRERLSSVMAAAADARVARPK